MGAGIAQTAAEAGFAVKLYDWEPETVTKVFTA
ncbi:3-hydroxyacyl-CoA dehydrogenase NAD-binding domain-containing protein [Bacillus velezensis]